MLLVVRNPLDDGETRSALSLAGSFHSQTLTRSLRLLIQRESLPPETIIAAVVCIHTRMNLIYWMTSRRSRDGGPRLKPGDPLGRHDTITNPGYLTFYH